jgi:ribosomal protein S18 acetylase RimI-like enzyme
MADLSPHRLHPDDPDLAAILPLLQRCFSYMEGRIDPPSSLHRLTPDSLADQARMGEIWVIGAPPKACVFLTPEPNTLYLGKLAVAPEMRGLGLARILVSLALDRARALGLPKVTLKTRIELTENHAAFRAMGFRKLAEEAHPGYDRPTTVIFEQRVT